MVSEKEIAKKRNNNPKENKTWKQRKIHVIIGSILEMIRGEYIIYLAYIY